MPRIGYARVSTLDQDLDWQVTRLTAEGCAIIRPEKVSGGSREGRDELATILEFLRPGDELVVTRLDRLGRDTRDVLNIVHEAEEREAFVTVLDPQVTTRGERGHIVPTVLGMVAQMSGASSRNGSARGLSGRGLRAFTRAASDGSTGTASSLCTQPAAAQHRSQRRSGARGCKCIEYLNRKMYH